MKIFFVVILFLSACSYTPTIPNDLGLESSGVPEKTMVYQVKDGTETIGYVHRYEWEPKVGKIYYYYIVHDVVGNVVGFTRQDGHTEVYTSNVSQFVGNYPVVPAVGTILATSAPIQIVPEPKEEMDLRLAQESEDTKDSDWSWYKTSTSSSSPRIEPEKTESKQEESPNKNKFEEEEYEEPAKQPEPKKPSPKPAQPQAEEEWPEESEPWPSK